MVSADMQAIILAGGEGSKMFPLTEGFPKCLLPVANIPMISYVVKYLENSGLSDIIVVVQAVAAVQIKQALSLHTPNMNIDVVSLPEDEEDVGTADALRAVKDKIHGGDILVVSSDTITDVPLHRLVDVHRTYDSSFTAMLANRVEIQQNAGEPSKNEKKKAQKDPNYGTRDIVIMDKQEGRLILLNNEADQEEENISLKKTVLQQYPEMKVEMNLSDSHIYLMKNWTFNYLCNEYRIENIKSDFVPHILRKQFSKPKKTLQYDGNEADLSYLEEDGVPTTDTRNTGNKDIYSYCVDDEMAKYMREWSGYKGKCLRDQIKCHCIIADGFCLRVNTLPAYTHINKEFHKLKETFALPAELLPVDPGCATPGERCHFGNDCFVGKLSSVGNNVVVKKSVVGDNCILGCGVKISNCVIMENVTIGEGCKLQNSIICNDVIVAGNSTVTNCQISCGQELKEEGGKYENEQIVQEEMEFDDDDDEM